MNSSIAHKAVGNTALGHCFSQYLRLKINLAILINLSLLSLTVSGAPRASVSAELLYFTDDLTGEGGSLFPDFDHHSIWSAIGRASNGKIYFAVSNHKQSSGNVAVYVFEPGSREMRLVGDLKSISTAVNNWMPEESQFKVHTFLMQHADGFIYFMTDDYEPSVFLRGSHLYRIDPSTDKIEDVSKIMPRLVLRDLSIAPNTGENREGSGVLIEYYGIKGIGLNKNVPDLLYAMTYPDGHLIKIEISTGEMSVVGRSGLVNYVFYVDDSGNVYYGNGDEQTQSLLKFDPATGETSVIVENVPPGDFGGYAPTEDDRYVYFLIAGTKRIFRLDTQEETFGPFASVGGSNWWRLYNLSLSPDEKSLYFISNNNDRKVVRRLDINTRESRAVLNLDRIIGARDLSFGGVNIWDNAGSFYAPVWSSKYNGEGEIAILKVDAEIPEN